MHHDKQQGAKQQTLFLYYEAKFTHLQHAHNCNPCPSPHARFPPAPLVRRSHDPSTPDKYRLACSEQAVNVTDNTDFPILNNGYTTNSRGNKSAQSNFARGPRRGAVAHVRPVGPCGQWCAPNSPPKVPLTVDRSPNPTICLITGPVRPTMPNGLRI